MAPLTALNLPVLLEVLDSSIEGVLVVDHRTRAVLHYNRRFLEMMNIPEQVAADRDDRSLIACVLERLVDPEPFLDLIERLYDEPERTSTDELVFKTGRVFQRHSVPLRTGGQLVARIWYFRDISELRSAVTEKTTAACALSEALRRSSMNEKSFRAIFDHSPIGIIQLDSKLRYVSVNEAHSRFLGYTEDELRQMTMMDVTHPDDVNLSLDVVASFAGTDRHINRFEKRYVRKSGEIVWGLVSSRSVRFEESGEYVLFSVIEDITAIKRRESDLRAAEAKLVYASKMSLLGEMAGGIAHEINNPLAIIHAKAGQLRARLTAGSASPIPLERLAEELAKIEGTAERIDRIIKGLRLFSRNADRDPMELTSVASIIEATIELCSERLKRGPIDVRVDLGADVVLECRPTQISQILMNLLSNAYDAIEAGPPKDRAHPAKWIRISMQVLHAHNDATLRLDVIDSGHGIPAELRAKIMLPFFTTKEPGRGTGLGLSISKSIAEEHGGRLTYDPASPNTRFVLELPLRQPIRQAEALLQ